MIDLFFVQVDQTILVYSLCALSTWKFSAGTTRQSKFCKYFFAHVTISCAQAACSWCESNFNTPGIMTYARFCLSQCYCCVNSCNAFWVPKFRCSVNALLQFVLAAYMHRVSHKHRGNIALNKKETLQDPRCSIRSPAIAQPQSA